YFAADGFLRDPERYPHRTGPAAARGSYTGGASPGYTYPDHQNFFLAHMDPTSGRVLVPPVHREYLFGNLADPNNPNWANAQGKYLTARPRPKEHPNFPLPTDRWGDVKNIDWAPGGCDSIWMPFGAPILTAPDGRRYTMLIAPL